MANFRYTCQSFGRGHVWRSVEQSDGHITGGSCSRVAVYLIMARSGPGLPEAVHFPRLSLDRNIGRYWLPSPHLMWLFYTWSRIAQVRRSIRSDCPLWCCRVLSIWFNAVVYKIGLSGLWNRRFLRLGVWDIWCTSGLSVWYRSHGNQFMPCSPSNIWPSPCKIWKTLPPAWTQSSIWHSRLRHQSIRWCESLDISNGVCQVGWTTRVPWTHTEEQLSTAFSHWGYQRSKNSNKPEALRWGDWETPLYIRLRDQL